MSELTSRFVDQINLLNRKTGDQGLHIRTFLKEASRSGIRRRDAKREVASVLSAQEYQKLLADWSRIEDREELRTRLELLRYIPELDSELDDFLLFFFRASDPVIYQTAAQTLGIQMRRSPRLKEWFLGYLNRHSIPLDKPVRFTGERSRRRVSIALAAWYAEESAGSFNELSNGEESSLPLPLEPNVETYKEHLDSADLNACLISLRILLDGKTGLYSWETDALLLISDLTERTVQVNERYLIRSASLLLVSLENVESGQIAYLWGKLLRQILDSLEPVSKHPFTVTLQRLNQVDELLHQTPKFRGAIAEEILGILDGIPSTDTRLFLLVRMAIWHQRIRGGALPSEIHYRFMGIDTESGILIPVRKYLLSSDGLSPDHMLDTSQSLHLFFLISRRLETRHKWLAMLPAERAMTAFFLNDLAVFELEDLEEVGRRLSTLEQDRDSDSTPESDFASPPTSTVRLLLLAHRRESIQSLPADSNLIHQIRDHRLLLSLIPENRKTELLDTLADAFEHQLRLSLLRNPEFDVPLYLYRIASRKPHPSLFDQLYRTCKGRPYTYSDGREVHLIESIEQFREDARQSEDLREDSNHLIQDHDHSRSRNSPPGSATTNRFEDLDRFRSDLITLYRNDDLFESLRHLVRLLEPMQGQQDSGVEENDAWLYRLLPEEHAEREKVQITYNTRLKRIRTLIPGLLPDHLAGKRHPVTDTIFELEKIIREIEQDLGEYLSRYDRQLLGLVIEDLMIHLFQWRDSLQALGEWINKTSDLRTTGMRTWDEGFKMLGPLPSQPMRNQMIRILFRSLHVRTMQEVDDSQHWYRRHQFARAAALSPYRKELSDSESEIWEDELSAVWTDLLDEAIHEQYETRAQMLLDEEVFQAIYQRPSVKKKIYDSRSWFYDRYSYRQMRKQSVRERPGLLNLKRDVLTLRSYLLHFTNIWIALIIGAILMLDFGDAWMALAEIGDTSGIALTFLIGTLAAGGYLYVDLKAKTAVAPEDNGWERALSRWFRVGQFLLISLIFTLAVTSLLWLLFSSTEEVLHGPEGVLHIFGWTGFALLVGIFFGLLSKSGP